MSFHSECKNHAFNKTMRRFLISKQVLKLCFTCKRPFNRGKGRSKAVAVIDVPGRFICKQCFEKHTKDEANETQQGRVKGTSSAATVRVIQTPFLV